MVGYINISFNKAYYIMCWKRWNVSWCIHFLNTLLYFMYEEHLYELIQWKSKVSVKEHWVSFKNGTFTFFKKTKLWKNKIYTINFFQFNFSLFRIMKDTFQNIFHYEWRKTGTKVSRNIIGYYTIISRIFKVIIVFKILRILFLL